ERRNGEGLDAVGLDATAGVDNQVVLLKDGVDIVGVAVARNQTGVENLETAVHHPSTSSTLGVTSEVLLEDTQDGITLGAAEVAELLADDRRLVLVVGLCGGTVERGNAKVVYSETPGSEGTTEGSNGR